MIWYGIKVIFGEKLPTLCLRAFIRLRWLRGKLSSLFEMELNRTQHDNMRCEISENQVKFYEIYAWWIKGITSVCISTFGIIFNTIAIYVLCHKRMRGSFFNRLLVGLTIVDSLFLANGIYVSLLKQVKENNRYENLVGSWAHTGIRDMFICTTVLNVTISF